MKKNLLYAALWLMGLMGTLAIWVVNAETIISHYTWSNIEYRLNDHTEHFTWVWTITITDWTDTITILDRNLWAKKAWTGCEDSSWWTACAWWDDTYWYHFQRWNNYGFNPLDTSIKENAKPVSSDWVVWSGIYDNSWYYGTTFIKSDYSHWYDYWKDSTNSSSNHENLWWWELDYDDANNWFGKNNENRRGPCPEWFHVPSYGELQKLQNMLNADGKRNKDTLHDKLLIPFAGLRSAYASVDYVGYYARFWSSSPGSASIPNSPYLNFDVGGLLIMGSDRRDNAFSVRCFYDSYQPFTQSFTLSFMGSEWGSVSTWSIEAEKWSSISRDDEAGSVTISWTVVATGIADEWYVFSWWLTDCVSGTVTTGCSFTGVFKTIPYTITYLWTGDDYVPSATGYTIESDDITLENPTKIWYTFTWRSGTDLEWITWAVIISKWSTWDRVYEANREANEYTITVDIDGNETILTWNYGDPISKPADPSKNGYKFIGWEPEFPTTMPLSGATVKAKWEKLWSSGGWGGRSSNTSDKDKDTMNNPSVTDVTAPLESGAQWDSDDGSPLSRGDTASAERGSTQNYTQEFQEAYKFAKEKWITTMPNIQEAQMDWKLTRIAMAKMLSQYAMSVLWQKPANIVTPKFNDVTDKQNSDYDDWVSLAYQLWIMWQNMPDNNFRPNDEVTRAEFATALSRMLYHTSDWEYKSTDKYYTNHMKKLVQEKIITNDDAKMKELRWYVMIMLMRSAGK